MQLPDPGDFGDILLPDGSRIYPSGSAAYPVKPGRWFAWLRIGEVLKGDGLTRVHSGCILLERDGIKYFDTAEEAAKAINRIRRNDQKQHEDR